MFLTDGFNIRIPRGDSADIRITFTDTDGVTPYIFSPDQYAHLSVFPVRGAEPVIVKNALAAEQNEDGSVIIHLSPEDTDIPVNVYFYSIKLKDVSGCDTYLGFPRDAFFAVGMDCPTAAPFSADGTVNVTVDSAPSAPAQDDSGTHYSEMPFTDELTGLYEPDSLDIPNSLWRSKITGGNDMTLIGGTLTDNALKFVPGEYGHADAVYPYTLYLVVKKPVTDNARVLCGSIDSSLDKPSIVIWTGDGQGSNLFELTYSGQNYLRADGDPQEYHVISCTVADCPNNAERASWQSAFMHWMVDGRYIGSEVCMADATGERGYINFNGSIGLNCRACGNAGNIDYSDHRCTQDSYYRAFAFGGKQTLEQMQANHRYLYEKYCTR